MTPEEINTQLEIDVEKAYEHAAMRYAQLFQEELAPFNLRKRHIFVEDGDLLIDGEYSGDWCRDARFPVVAKLWEIGVLIGKNRKTWGRKIDTIKEKS